MTFYLFLLVSPALMSVMPSRSNLTKGPKDLHDARREMMQRPDFVIPTITIDFYDTPSSSVIGESNEPENKSETISDPSKGTSPEVPELQLEGVPSETTGSSKMVSQRSASLAEVEAMHVEDEDIRDLRKRR